MAIKKGNIVIEQHPNDEFREFSKNFRRINNCAGGTLLIEPDGKDISECFSHIIRIPIDLLLHLGFEYNGEQKVSYKGTVFIKKIPNNQYEIFCLGHKSRKIDCVYELQNTYYDFTNGEDLDVADFNSWDAFYPNN